MSDNPRRTGRSGAVFVALIVGGSAVGVARWYALTSGAPRIANTNDFDLSAPPAATASPTTGGSIPLLPATLEGDAQTRSVDSKTSAPGGQAAAPIAKPGGQPVAPVPSGPPAAGGPAARGANAAGPAMGQGRSDASLQAFAGNMAPKYPTDGRYERNLADRIALVKPEDDGGGASAALPGPAASVKSRGSSPAVGGGIELPDIASWKTSNRTLKAFLLASASGNLSSGTVSQLVGSLGGLAPPGTAPPPPESIPITGPDQTTQAIINEANQLAAMHLPYTWGGGHESTPAVPDPGLDCSGAVSWVLQRSGFSFPTAIANYFMDWGDPVPDGTNMDQGVFVYVIPGVHTFLRVNGHVFESTGWPNDATGGPQWTGRTDFSGTVVRRVPNT